MILINQNFYLRSKSFCKLNGIFLNFYGYLHKNLKLIVKPSTEDDQFVMIAMDSIVDKAK